ncbi:hypothetical protein N1851_005221 [Merluccius polli]|uniref:Uncharacterized protein n=1 Tax=Merluccius polli TaxID=89951 RepID=A0AA47N657_MERPO|nr:hypothetical protein N1851_005221 [Merluccius polli]
MSDPIPLQKALKKIAYLKEDIRKLAGELRRKETQLSSFSEKLREKETMLSSYSDLAMKQSREISNLSAAIQDTIHWDSTCPRPASSTPSPLWSEVVVRNRNGRHGQRAPPPCLNLANRYSVFTDSEVQMPAAVGLPATATPRRSPSPASLPAAQAGAQPESRLPLPGPSAAAVCTGAAAGRDISPAGSGGSRAADPKADGCSRREDNAHPPIARSVSATSSIRRQLLRVAIDRRSGGPPCKPTAAVICPQNPGSTSPLEPSTDAPVIGHRPSSQCASGQSGGEGEEQQQQHSVLGSWPASPQLASPPPSTIIVGDSII